MKKIVFLVEGSDEGGFTAHATDESIFTQADSMESLRDEVRDAVRCHFGEDELALKMSGFGTPPT